MPYYLIQNGSAPPSKVPCTWAEYHAAIMPVGTPVRFRTKKSFPALPKEGTGILKYIWNYDGIIAQIEVMGQKETVSLYLALGDKMKRLKNTQMLASQGCRGDGV